MRVLAREGDLKAGSGGIVGWLLKRIRGEQRPRSRLTVLERVPLGTRQTLALVEADGHKILIAAAPECTPALFALENIDQSRSDVHSTDQVHTIPVRGTVC